MQHCICPVISTLHCGQVAGLESYIELAGRGKEGELEQNAG